jgi:uncharacterized protein with PIN domain
LTVCHLTNNIYWYQSKWRSLYYKFIAGSPGLRLPNLA